MSDQESASSASPSATNPEVDIDAPNYPTTPMNGHLNAQAPGELSPPRSGDAQPSRLIAQSITDPSADMIDEDIEDAQYDSPVEGGLRDRRTANGEGEGGYIPGSGWNNKKAQDEFHRALENVVDQDFSVAEFGDPLLDSAPEGGTSTGRDT
ncbi:hypothetical protein UCRPC4_g01319 [Phaeomoniella chlamydospora]|uniref:Uncharacterized protein n=1 Tax=Phaeomoniella chlamydospora TaxID=158046 RepID=A0A0G2EXX3_PHACM|nr:hypothetical protein UCRPC4_g01319 [Phaeomoniella chlamydospora]